MIVDDKTRAQAIDYADAMVVWLDGSESIDTHPDWDPSSSVDRFGAGYDLARDGAERAIDKLTDYSLYIGVRWSAVAAMLRLGWCPGDPVPAEIIARWAR